MTSDPYIAFDHPEARAIATALPEFPDRISVRDYQVEVEIGAFQVERDVKQRVSFNIVVELTGANADLDDDVDRILSYDRVTEAIEHELASQRLNLLETLAEQIADRILLEPQAGRVFVRIEKLDRGPGVLGVEIVRMRGEGVAKAPSDTPRPRVVFLANDSMVAPGIGDFVAGLEGPLILCVDLPNAPLVQSGDGDAQRHIDLLGIEQNAWVLAAQFDGASVVETRTELDWSMKNGQLAIWAPARIVLDAVDMPDTDPLGLAIWLAEGLGAVELVSVGKPLPSTVTIPARSLPLPQ